MTEASCYVHESRVPSIGILDVFGVFFTEVLGVFAILGAILDHDIWPLDGVPADEDEADLIIRVFTTGRRHCCAVTR